MTEREESDGPMPWRWGVFVLGLLLLAAIPVRWFVFFDVPRGEIPSVWLVEAAFSGGFAAAITIVGLWIVAVNRVVPEDLQRMVVVRCLTGFAFFALIVALLLHVGETISPAGHAYYTLFAGSIGTAVGLVVGMQEVRSIRRARQAAQKETEVERMIQERERLSYLNAVLRHEVLNNVSIIRGYAELLLDDPPESPEDHLRTIYTQADEMAEIITDIRLMLESLQLHESDDYEPLDIAPVLNEEIQSLRELYNVSRVRVDVPGEMLVEGPPALQHVFRNLLTNAVIHNDSHAPEVAVSAECTDESIRIRIADNGAGISESEQDSLFEVGTEGDHGFGLYIASEVLESCGGTLELTRTGPGGSVFMATIPRPVPDQSRGVVVDAVPA